MTTFIDGTDTCAEVLAVVEDSGLVCAAESGGGTGVLCLVTKQTPNEIAVLRSAVNPYVRMPMDEFYFDVFAHEDSDRITVNYAAKEKEGDGRDLHYYAAIDVPSMQMTVSPGYDFEALDGYYLIDDVSPDGSVLITGSHALYPEQGTAEALINPCTGKTFKELGWSSGSYDGSLPRGYDTAKNPSMYVMLCDVTEEDGSEHFHLWIDGEEIKSVPLERKLGLLSTRYMVGAGGLVVFDAGSIYTGNRNILGFNVYSIEDQAWKVFTTPEIWRSTGDIPFEVCETKKQFVTADYDGVLRLYDFGSGELVKEISMTIPAGNILDMQFALDDQVLLIMDDATPSDSGYGVYAIDMNTGEMLFEDMIEGETKLYSEMFARVDEATNSLYLCDMSGDITCLRIDLESWSVLAEIKGLADVVASGKYVVCRDDGDILVYPAYSLETLMEWGSEMID